MFIRINDTLLALADIRKADLETGRLEVFSGRTFFFTGEALEVLKKGFEKLEEDGTVLNLDKLFKHPEDRQVPQVPQVPSVVPPLTEDKPVLLGPPKLPRLGRGGKVCPLAELHPEMTAQCPSCGVPGGSGASETPKPVSPNPREFKGA